MKRLGIGSLVEIQITTKHLVGTFARQHHLYSHRLYHTGKKIHRSRSAYRGYIIGLNKVDNVAYGIETFLNGIVYLVVNGSYMVCHHLSLCKVGRTFQSYSKRVKTWPPCL